MEVSHKVDSRQEKSNCPNPKMLPAFHPFAAFPLVISIFSSWEKKQKAIFVYSDHFFFLTPLRRFFNPIQEYLGTSPPRQIGALCLLVHIVSNSSHLAM